MTLLEAHDLVVTAGADEAPILDGVSYRVGEGSVTGLVGESGSGKTTAALALLGFLPPGLATAGGSVRLGNEQCEAGRAAPMTRGRVSMIFQNPIGALNPTMRVGTQIGRVLRQRQGLRGRDGRAAAVAMLEQVGIAAPERVVRSYPHQLSGGMSQRVMIALALACRPQLLIADEPTTALDVTVQAQILRLLGELIRDTGCGMLFITHDLGVVAEICDEVVVLKDGKVVEAGPVGGVFDAPQHDYTRYLLGAFRGDAEPEPERQGRGAGA